jgi:hypothetical protein
MTRATDKAGTRNETAERIPDRGERNMANEQNTTHSILRVLRQIGVEGITRKQWLAIRKASGPQIDPNNAEVISMYRDALSYRVVGMVGVPELEHFARSPESDEWVRFCDLPDDTRLALCTKHNLFQASTVEFVLDQLAASKMS